MNKTIVNRFIAKILVFIMIIGYAAPFGSVREVSAAPTPPISVTPLSGGIMPMMLWPVLDVGVYRGLNVQAGSSAPVRIGEPRTPNQVVAHFDTIRLGQQEFGTFVLEYYVSRNRFVQLEVEITPGSTGPVATVEYRVYQPPAGVTPIPPFDVSWTLIHHDPTYMVFHPSQGWMNISDYLDAPGRPIGVGYRILNDHNAPTVPPDPPTLTPPRFEITDLGNTWINNGFSFQYDGRMIHISFRDGVFIFASDGFVPGSMYELRVTHDTWGSSEIVTVNTGLIGTGPGGAVRAVPFANVDRILPPPSGASRPDWLFPIPIDRRYDGAPVIRNPFNPPVSLLWPPLGGPSAPGGPTWDYVNDVWPAPPDQELGVMIEFVVPYFVGPILHNDNPTRRSDQSVPITIRLWYEYMGPPPPVPPGIQVTVDDIFGDFIPTLGGLGDRMTAADHPVDIANNIHLPNRHLVRSLQFQPDPNPGGTNNIFRIEILVEDPDTAGQFMPGVLFSNTASTIGLATEIIPNIYARSNTIPDAYTFLHYRIIPHQGGYAIEVLTPFRGAVGEYLVQERIFPAPEIPEIIFRQTVVGNEERLIFPISDAVTNAPRHFQIHFTRGNFPVDNSVAGPGVISSQVLIFWPTPRGPVINTPEFFFVRPFQHTPRVLASGHERDAGTVEMQLNWDIGRVAEMREFFDLHAYPPRDILAFPDTDGWPHAPGNPANRVERVLYIDYMFNHSLAPIDLYPPNPNHERPFLWLRARIGSTDMLPRTSTEVNASDATVTFDYVQAVPGITLQPPDMSVPNAARIELFSAPGTVHYIARATIRVDSYYDHAPDALLPGAPPSWIPGPLPNMFYFVFPRIYFLNVIPTHHSIPNTTPPPGYEMVPVAGVGPSEIYSITIDGFDAADVPPPQNLRVHDETTTSFDNVLNTVEEVSFQVTWTVPAPQLRNYIDMSYGLGVPQVDGPGGEPRPDVVMNLYISSDEALMAAISANPERDPVTGALIHTAITQLAAPSPSEPGPTFDPEPNPDGTTFFFSNIRGNPVNIGSGTPVPRDILRDGGVIAITNIDFPDLNNLVFGVAETFDVTYKLDGLDRNERYFIFVDFIVTQRHPGREVSPPVIPPVFEVYPYDIVRASLLSNMVGAVTQGDRDVPDGLDQVPPAPNPINVRDIGLDTATIYWNRIVPSVITSTDQTEVLEYEVIRIRDNQMPAAHLNNRVPFRQVWDSISPAHADIIGFRTENSLSANYTLRGWGGSDWADTLGAPQFIFDPQSEQIIIKDNTLITNTLYFYYVRTVRTMRALNADGSLGAVMGQTYSVWNHVSVTTTIVEAPRNLRVESGEEREYDRQTQVMISFEAPLGNLGEIGNTLLFEYQLRIDDGEWLDPSRDFVLNESRMLENVEGSWAWLLYTISGLTPGQHYSVRVRMISIGLDGAESTSMWSNIAVFLTVMDQQAEDDNRVIRDWNNHLRDELERLLRNPFWTLRQDANAFHVIYRPTFFTDVIHNTTGSQIRLPLENAWQTTYFIPAAAFRQAWDAHMGFTVVNPNGNMEIIIPARSLDMDNNPLSLTIANGLRYNQFQDFMVAITINWSSPETVNGEPALTPAADVRIALQPARQNIAAWDAALLNTLRERIDEYLENPAIRRYIEEAVRGGVPAEEIARYVITAVENSRQGIIGVANASFTQVQFGAPLVMPTFDRGIHINTGADSTMAAVTALQYHGNNRWMPLTTAPFGRGQGIVTTVPGTYVFTGRLINIPGVEHITGGPVARAVVAKHGLDDFFGREAIDIAANTTRGAMVNSVARMMGAPRGTDAAAWLRANGIAVPAGNMNGPIPTQEALHLMMLVYEAQTGTRINSIRITNFNAVNNLQGLNPRFRDSLRAAVELNIVRSENLNPNAPLSVGDLLEILAALDSLVGL
ncbi:MAG: fibronectin type III domain-containing protein [Defluviitaleaceae bacterium]|nr:fibronectin type III domain-containing protein [Defluviitaleaceae bacterium]